MEKIKTITKRIELQFYNNLDQIACIYDLEEGTSIKEIKDIIRVVKDLHEWYPKLKVIDK